MFTQNQVLMDNSIVSERDNAYWDEYYEKKNVPSNPSSFARWVIEKIDKSKPLLELGCGNGRDSFFFARNNIQTIALDLSESAISLNESYEHENVTFKIADFTAIEDGHFNNVGSIYSRFTLHSVDRDSYLRTIDWCSRNLMTGGQLFIEARTVNDPLFGQGKKVSDDEFITTHYRRFSEIKDVMHDLEERGFELVHASENYTDSWYKTDHAVVYRIIVRKI